MKLVKFFYFYFVLIFMNCSKERNIVEEIETPINSARPNILLVLADDVSKDAIPNYPIGSTKANMPNLRGLMATGITFDNTWSYSVCTPTRASIITGKYGVKSGVIEVGDLVSTAETSIQKHIQNNTGYAYATAIIGKWHLTKNAEDPITMGIDYYAGILNGAISDYNSWPLVENGTSSISNTYATKKLTDLAIDWVAEQTKPWFLWMAYNAPHTPFHLAPVALHSQGNLPTDMASIDANPLPYYLSALEALDTEMGRFLSSLSAEESANTIVIFIGDNGTPNRVAQAPYTRQTVKGSLYQGGINVPMVVSGKGVDRINERESALINSTDLYTTIGNIAGVSTSAIHNSKSFKGLLTDGNSAKRNFVYSEKEDAYTIRDAVYKYIKLDNGAEEFYNVSIDAYEESNLIGGTLSSEAAASKASLIAEANRIRN